MESEPLHKYATKWLHDFLNEPLPERVGWPHVFGSMLLALFGIQFLSGILLSFVYAPSPLSAYQSVHYILYELPGGDWLRGIHYWGASFIVILLALHMTRTFLYAAYRKPRQATWVAGVLLLLCTLGFAQTGYLLPWDQRAYWGTTVTIRIVKTVPLLGNWLATLINGGSAVGALTLSRFYSIHTVILPLTIAGLILAHLFFVRRYGITAPWSNVAEEPVRNIPFAPYQMAKDSTAMLLILALLLVLSHVLPTPLGNPADPTDSTFVPRPDWYFLFLFQLLHYFEGKYAVIGTFIIPALLTTVLFLLPYFDKNPSRRLRKRPIAILALFLSYAGFGFLTYIAVNETPKPPSWLPASGITVPRAERIKRPSEVAGMYVMQQNCFSCHSMTMLGSRPNLQTLTRSHFPVGGDWLQQHLTDQGKNVQLTNRDKEALMSVLRLVADKDPKLLYTIPRKVRFGANMFFTKACITCHRIDGQGGEHAEVKAPDLTLRLLRPKSWHIEHIKDAQSVVPNSKMPPFFHYEPYEFDALAEYILYLHTP
ncbi:MAG: hypothetical protein C5B54_11835 [Acidobacteria bacterium]|nr:MAG: hypothetical protein C5B54_11835 [Acidobacteriota bacterium]